MPQDDTMIELLGVSKSYSLEPRPLRRLWRQGVIVVLAAGNAPVLRFNPFDAISTVTVSIVNQLTGDTNFASPQALVAFALGLTLFVMTLILNVIALYVVRKYREQYE